MSWNDKCTDVDDFQYFADNWSCDCRKCSPRGVDMRREEVITDLTVMLSDMIASTKPATGLAYDERAIEDFNFTRRNEMLALLAAIRYLQHEVTKHSIHISCELDIARKNIIILDETIKKLTPEKDDPDSADT